MEERLQEVGVQEVKEVKKPKKKKATPKKVEVKEVKKNRKQVASELRRKMGSIDVEIMNISEMRVSHANKMGVFYFQLEPGESVIVSLEELYEVKQKAKKCFSNHFIILTDVYSEEYTMEDVMEYLGLNSLYKGIDDPNSDFLEQMVVDTDEEELEKLLEKKTRKEIKRLACKAMYLHHSEESDFTLSRGKEKVFCNALKIDELIK